MPTQILPPPTRIEQGIDTWPGPRRQGTAAAMTDNGAHEFDPAVDNRLVMNRTGTSTAVVFPAGTGTLAIQIGNAGVGLSSMSPQETIGSHPLTLIDASMNAGCLGPEYLRVSIARYWFRVIGAGVGTISDATCVGLWRPEAGGAGGVPNAGNAGFGLFGDGAGNIRYNNYQGGAFPGNRTEMVALPAGTITSLAEWNQAEWQLINGAPGRDASISLFINNVAILTRNWTGATGATLPDYSLASGGLGTSIFGPAFFVDENTDANVAVEIANFAKVRGRFTRGGVELLS